MSHLELNEIVKALGPELAWALLDAAEDDWTEADVAALLGEADDEEF